MKEEFAKKLLAKLQKDYNAIAQDFARRRSKPWKEAKFLTDLAFEGEKILDVGCGAGQWFEFFKEKKVKYFGVDFSENLIKIAKERYPEAKFEVANLFNLPFEDNFFDKVYAIALFHHIPSQKLRLEGLKEIKRVLKKNGFLILTVWDLLSKKGIKMKILKFALLKIFGRSGLDFKDILVDFGGIKNCYFHSFTQRELVRLVKKAGFDTIKKGKFLVNSRSNFYLVAQKLL